MSFSVHLLMCVAEVISPPRPVWCRDKIFIEPVTKKTQHCLAPTGLKGKVALEALLDFM